MKKPLEYVSLKKSDVALGFPEPTSIADLWTYFVPEYRSRNYGPANFSVSWDPRIARKIASISHGRTASRVQNYLIPAELNRVSEKLSSKKEASIRFGNLKTGHGYDGERGDFCLIAGVVTRSRLIVYYRSLELIGGFAYDLAMLRHLEAELVCNWKTITFVTAKAFVFALKGNSNEKLYPKLRAILQG